MRTISNEQKLQSEHALTDYSSETSSEEDFSILDSEPVEAGQVVSDESTAICGGRFFFTFF